MRKRHTDDHCFMRSRKLHRDEDMLMDTLRYKIVYYREALLEHLSSRDQEKCGYVTLETFQVMFRLIAHTSERAVRPFCPCSTYHTQGSPDKPPPYMVTLNCPSYPSLQLFPPFHNKYSSLCLITQFYCPILLSLPLLPLNALKLSQ